MNTDGLEWKRGKWGFWGSKYYLLNEWLASKLFKNLISDSNGLQRYYKKRYKRDSHKIAYGAYLQESTDPKLIKKFDLKPQEYFLQITRFEPENNPLLTIQAFNLIKTEKKLVIIGSSKYKSTYYQQMLKKAKGNPNIIMPGAIYDKDLLRELWTNSYAYIHGNEVGGTNPALLQSMAAGCFVIARGCMFNREVLSVLCGIFYYKNIESLVKSIEWTLKQETKLLDSFKISAKNRIKQFYQWDDIAEGYEKLGQKIIN